MKKQILLIFILIIFSSCGARKVVVSTIKTETKKEAVIKTNVNVIKTVDVVKTANVITETITYTPVDPKLESRVDDIVFTNTKVVKEKKVAKKTENKVLRIEDKTEKKEEIKTEEVVEKKDKVVDRKAFSFLSLLWFLIPAAIIFLIWKYRKKIIRIFIPL